MNKAAVTAKAKADWRCQKCGSSEFLAAHHQIPGDDSSVIVLCGECHSKEHPNVPKALFVPTYVPELPAIIRVYANSNKPGAPKNYAYLHIPQALCRLANISPGTYFAVSSESFRVGKLILEQVKEDKDAALLGAGPATS